MSYTNHSLSQIDKPDQRRPSRLRGCLLVAGSTVVGLVGLIVAVFIFLIVSGNLKTVDQKQEITKRFKDAAPNARIQVDDYYSYSPPMDMFSGSCITLFQCDQQSINAVLKKWQGRNDGKRSIGSLKEFRKAGWERTAGGRYRFLQNKEVSFFYFQKHYFENISFSDTYLFWDAETGTGCIYTRYAD